MNTKLIAKRKLVLAGAVAGVLAVGAVPAFGETETEAQLRRELAEQKKMIERLMAAQEAQQEALSKTKAEILAASRTSAGTPTSRSDDSDIALYGVADANVMRVNSGFGEKTTFGSGGLAASRLGVKGSKAIGDGWSVVGLAEAGVHLDTGSVGNNATATGLNNTNASSNALNGLGTQIFTRQIYFGLKSGRIGTFTFGRQYAGSYIAAATSNAMGVGMFGYSGGILPAVGFPTRVNNSLVYMTPKFGGGFSAQAMYSTGSENNVSSDTALTATTKTNDKAGQGYDLALFYSSGPLYAVATTWNVYNASYSVPAAGLVETELARKIGGQVGASYDFGSAKLFATYVSAKISGGNYENVTKALSNSSGWSMSASIPLGKHRLYGSYTALDDKSVLNKDAKLIGLGYTYDLYKNTKLYASWGKMLNNGNASYSLPDSGDLVGNVAMPGFKPTGYMTGVNFSF